MRSLQGGSPHPARPQATRTLGLQLRQGPAGERDALDRQGEPAHPRRRRGRPRRRAPPHAGGTQGVGHRREPLRRVPAGGKSPPPPARLGPRPAASCGVPKACRPVRRIHPEACPEPIGGVPWPSPRRRLPSSHPPGSTACTALKRGRNLLISNVGDSRAVPPHPRPPPTSPRITLMAPRRP